MRQKKIKHVNLDLMNSLGVVTDIKEISFDNNKDVYLEIGSGKGNFITTLAKDNPDNLYIAIEKNISVCYRIVEKRDLYDLSNLIIILGDSEDILEYFTDNTVKKIYLNFSDPWPKARHHKRRLTYPTYLNNYKKILKNDGEIQFRTDHIDLFNDSVEYLNSFFEEVEIDRNHVINQYFTEYEEKKSKIGNIYQCRFKVGR
ncbi:tRNA (guanosine(46)-N7)-methyltransferase TrmB [Haploplasma axanthum]|uniref:tRNA (guanine-N(7)-)-methyltransferase n=1 Tax=Haploplasma axanthum TaxID=29552 RepID=A0A449BEM5_HAPAX|nr:tRNA (guanosine(46)-N7)-methyltransferase TrmB [Haploplasma axanthum]VEU80760.1 tRNA (guanine-N(7)-)-methyltransferase [Haploplasma axanthum]